ncbi:hypothetical protein MWU84_22315 [Arenibacter sp. F20364]|nr:hypothetical protein [Arenibacter sp. F20364]
MDHYPVKSPLDVPSFFYKSTYSQNG